MTQRAKSSFLFAALVALLAPSGCGRKKDPSHHAASPVIVHATQQLLTTGLIGRWQFDETNGDTALDSSIGGGNHATFQGTPLWESGRVTGSAKLNGGSYFQVPPSTSLNAISTAVTVAGWFRRETNPATGDQYLIYRRNGQLGSVLHMLVGPDGGVCFAVKSEGICDGAAPIGQWHHVAGTWDGAMKKLYVDGVLRSQTAGVGSVSFENNYELFIGANQNGALSFNGQLDDWRIYNRGLNAQEVWSLSHPEAPNCEVAASGSACDDGNPCTIGESCQAGLCSASGATTNSCDDDLFCSCPTQKRAVLVVGETTPLTADDLAIKSRLQGLGYAVLTLRDRAVLPLHLAGKDLAVISETVSSHNVVPSLGTVETPIVNLEPSLYPTFGMTGSTFGVDFGDAVGTSITIEDPTAALAAGQTGTSGVATSPSKLIFGVPAQTAVVASSLGLAAGRATVFGYYKGSSMVTGTAPARRVGFFAGSGTAPALTAAGWSSFDAAVGWAVSKAPSALLVVGAQSPAGDAALRGRLTAMHYDVHTVAGTALTPSHATPHRLAVISETVASGSVGGKLAGVAVPVMVSEAAVLGAMGLTGETWGTHQGVVESTAGVMTVDVVGTGHPLAAGLSGTTAVGVVPLKIQWGVPSGSAIKIATLPGSPERSTIFAYRTGAAMVKGNAAARRLAFFAGDAAPAYFNDKGGRLFDAAVRWLTAPEKNAAMVVANAASVNSSDEALRRRLVGLDYEVDLFSGSTVAASSVAGAEVVVISESISSSTLGTRLTALAVPIVVLEPAVFDELGMTADGWQSAQGDKTAQTQVVISDTAHPLAAGLMGNVTVLSSPEKLVWGTPPAAPGASALKIATIVGEAEHQAIFAYEKASRMASGLAPARRVGWFAGFTTAAGLTTDGWRLFDAAIRWSTAATDGCVGQLDGAPCEDGNACTLGDRCLQGACAKGEETTCNDQNACTIDVCKPNAGCSHDGSGSNGSACDDANACTTGDVCSSGTCAGTPGSPICALTPRVACVEDAPTGGLIAHLGFANPGPTEIMATAGSAQNSFSPAPALRGQPDRFPSGLYDVFFKVAFAEPVLSWTLGDDTVVATAQTVRCCAGAPPPGSPIPSSAIVYRDGWETCANSWRGQTGVEASYAGGTPAANEAAGLTEWARCSASTGRVQKISGPHAGAGFRSSWFSLIPVKAEQPYCLAAWISWIGGPRPFVDVLRFDDAMTPFFNNRNRLIGGGDDGFGGVATPVSNDDGFRRYRKSFVAPAGTSFLQIQTGLEGDPAKGQEPLAYFDDVVVSTGACSF